MASASLQQRTPAWHAARKGKLTASNIGAVLGLCPWTSRLQAYNRAMGLDKFVGKQFSDALGRAPLHTTNALLRLLLGAGNDACKWGTENEPNGILAYSAHTGNVVQNTGLHVHPYTSWLAGSPDGLVGESGLLEVKCPYHFKKDGRLHKEIPAHYYMQINLCLEATEREWCDFISWAPEGYKIFRVKRDKDLHDAMMPHYLRFFAAMQRMSKAPPPLSPTEKEEIKSAVTDSMTRCIDYEYWDRMDTSAVPPSPEPEEDEDAEVPAKRAKHI